MKDTPCKTCERKGCGSYHDKCEPYIQWKKEKAQEDLNTPKRERYKDRKWR